MSEDLGAVVLSLVEEAQHFASGPEGAQLLRRLRFAMEALSRPPERHAAAEQALRSAAEQALALAWSQPVPAPWLLDLGAALSGSIGAQPRAVSPLVLGAATSSIPLASHDQPAIWAATTRFVAPPADPAPVSAPALALVNEGADDPFDAPAPPEPRALQPVEAFDPAALAPPLVTVLPEVGLPVPVAEQRAARALRALDSIAMHARHRVELAFAAAASEDERMLAWLDAARIQGDALPVALSAWWSTAKVAPDAYRVAAPMLVLASFTGDDTFDAIERALSAFPEDAPAAVAPAAEALALTAHPQLSTLARDLLRAAHPVARAVGIDLGRRLGTIEPAALRAALGDPNLSVVTAASRACASPAMGELVPALGAALSHPHPVAAWSIARALTLAGLPDAIDLLRRDAAFAARLGERVIDLVVLAGGAVDQPLLLAAVKRAPPSRHALRALAAFGHPRTWLYLAHQLADEELADFAADALETIFGALVPEEERTLAPAWRAALTEKKLDPEVRLWRGQPWHPSLLAQELTEKALSRAALEARGDEVRARLALTIELDLSGWTASADASARPFLHAIGGERSGYRRGTWWSSAGGTR